MLLCYKLTLHIIFRQLIKEMRILLLLDEIRGCQNILWRRLVWMGAHTDMAELFYSLPPNCFRQPGWESSWRHPYPIDIVSQNYGLLLKIHLKKAMRTRLVRLCPRFFSNYILSRCSFLIDSLILQLESFNLTIKTSTRVVLCFERLTWHLHS